MDKGNNLESLTEEEEEQQTLVNAPEQQNESDESDDDDSDDDSDDGDGGVRKDEPNKFDLLADGVLNSLALVHNALKELLNLKDELLASSLPPTVLSTIALVSGRVFRSITDMHMPVNELVRLVRVYSTPWEEKSTALKKLHEDYETKMRQLNIAIKRLALVDTHSKRIAKEKRIMNWEKLFAKMTTAKGHGRRWKFRIESFKQKAKLGMEPLQRYINEIEAESSDEEVAQQEMRRKASDEPDTAIQRASPTSPAAAMTTQPDNSQSEETPSGEAADKQESQQEEEGSGKDADKEKEAGTKATKEGEELEGKEEDEESGASSDEDSGALQGMEDISLPDETPEVTDRRKRRSVDTKAAMIARQQVPVYIKPETSTIGVWTHEPEYDRTLHIRVYRPEALMFRDVKCVFKCGEQTRKTETLDPEEEQEETAVEVTGKRGLIGTQGKTEAQTKEKKKKRFQELVFEIPNTREKIKEPTPLKTSKSSAEKPRLENVRIAVHYGPKEELVAMATIEMSDLKSLELPSVYEPDPKGDDLEDGGDIFAYKMDDSDTENEPALRNKEPIMFPLFSINPGRGEQNKPIGNLPLLCFWGKRLRPRTFNRITESETLTDIVHDLTGFDLRYVTKEELHHETEDRALSAICFTPELQEPEEETVSKSDYDKLLLLQREEMQVMQESYEQHIQELTNTLNEMQMALAAKNEEVVVVRTASPDKQHRPITPRRSPGSASLSRSTTSLSMRRVSPQVVPTPPEQAGTEPADVQSEAADIRPSSARVEAGGEEGVRVVRRTKPAKPSNLPNWGENLPKDFMDRLKMFSEGSERHRQELADRTRSETQKMIEKKLAGEYKLGRETDNMYDSLQDVSLPAVFMPTKMGNVYNPRAHQYFHPLGSSDFRLTQPPSMFQLPPLAKNKAAVVNLFDMSKNFRSPSSDWLMQRYMQTQSVPTPPQKPSAEVPITPPPTFVPQSRQTEVEGHRD